MADLRFQILAATGALLLTAAAPSSAPRGSSLQPGLWQFANVPDGASLDGRALDDLPYTPPAGPETICLDAAVARDPARFFARDSADCTLTRRSIAGGKVDIRASCPAAGEGLAPGTVHLTGTWTSARYALRFGTVNHGENGTMGFTGSMTGKRIGDCPKG